MIVPDANVLLYAYDQSCVQHGRARLWWESALSGHEPVRIPLVIVLAFIRITTHPRVYERPMTIEEAVSHVSAWFSQPNVAVLKAGPRHWEVLSHLLTSTSSGANLTTDAHIAALAIENGATIYSRDADYRRFPGVRVTNPLLE